MMNLSQFGATPATAGTPAMSPMNAYSAFTNNINKGTVNSSPNNPTTSLISNFASSLPSAIGQTAKDVGSNTVNQLKGAGQGFMQAGQDFNQGRQELGTNFLGGAEKLGESGLRAFASSVQGLFSPVTGTLQTAVEGAGNAGADVLGSKTGDALNNSPQVQKIDDVTNKIQQKVTDFTQKNPGKAQAIQDAVTTLATVLGEPELENQTGDLIDKVKSGVDTVKQGLTPEPSQPTTVYRGQEQGQQGGKFFSTSPDEANNYAGLNKNSEVITKDISGAKLKPVTSQTMLSEMENPDPNYHGVTFPDPRTGKQTVALFNPEEDLATKPTNTDNKIDPAEVLKNPHSVDEQDQAASQGRVQMQGGKKIILPSKYDLAMQKAIQPLIDDGKITGNKEFGTGLIKGEDQIKNIANTNDEITKIGGDTSNALKNSEAIWNSNELKGVANKVEIPDPVKNEPTMARNAASLRRAISSLGDEASKKADGTQDVLQNFDKYVKQNYGENFFGKGRSADPFHSYVFSLRDGLNDWAASKLPDGELPSGESYRDARLRQYNLINAKDEMTAKLTREYPEEVGKFQRVMKAHPALRMGARILGRQLLKVPITLGEGELGLTQLERSIAKPK